MATDSSSYFAMNMHIALINHEICDSVIKVLSMSLKISGLPDTKRVCCTGVGSIEPKFAGTCGWTVCHFRLMRRVRISGCKAILATCSTPGRVAGTTCGWQESSKIPSSSSLQLRHLAVCDGTAPCMTRLTTSATLHRQYSLKR